MRLGMTHKKWRFQTLKDRLTQAPLLLLPNDELPFVVMTNASDYATGAVLMQDQGKGLQPVEYLSRRLGRAEMCYTTPTTRKCWLSFMR